MADSTGHVRSSSLPSNAHPLVASVEDQLSRMKAASQQETSSSISNRLESIKDLYERVDDLIHWRLPKALCHEHLEDVLDGSLRLLDVCGTIRDVLSRMRESLQALESSLRRRNGRVSGLAIDIRVFMVTRKETNKMIFQFFKNLKGTGWKFCKSTVLDKDSETAVVVRMLREAEEISLAVFDFLLSFTLTKLRSKPKNGWSIVSKLLHSKRASSREQVEASEAEKLEAELILTKAGEDIKLVQVQQLLKDLEAFQSTIKETKEEFDCIFRQLLKARVSLLNILNHYCHQHKFCIT